MDRIAARNLFDRLVEITTNHYLTHNELPLGFILAFPDDRVVPVPAAPGVWGSEVTKAIQQISEVAGARYVLSAGETWMLSPESESEDSVTVTVDGPDIQLVGTINVDGRGGEVKIERGASDGFPNLSGMVGIN